MNRQHIAIDFPGDDTPAERVRTGSWDRQLAEVRDWLRNLKREFETPDLWTELERERELVGGGPGPEVENTLFTEAEKLQIGSQLRETHEYVRSTAELTADQRQVLEARLVYLEGAASRVGRIDWRNAFVGAMLSLVVEAIVPAEVVREVLRLGLQSLGQLFGGLGELPMGPPG